MTDRIYPFRNLVFQGGGMKMFAYHGALQVLEEEGILAQIERVAGASSGSLTAMLVSLRLSAAETIALFQRFDYSRIPDAVGSSEDEKKSGKGVIPAQPQVPHADPVEAKGDGEKAEDDQQTLWDLLPGSEMGQNLQSAVGNLQALTRLVNQHGWYANHNLYRWMGDLLDEQCGDRRVTFGDLQTQGRRELFIVATNLSRRETEIFSAATTPNVAVVDALLLSQSIPFFFEAPRFDGHKLGAGDVYTDGGVLDNYPLQLFDEPRHAFERNHFADGINWETLGCRLFTPSDCKDHNEISTLIDYVVNLFALNSAEDIGYASNPTARERTVEISNCCVDSTDFDIRPFPDDERYCNLVEAGHTAMAKYLTAFGQ